MTIRFVEEARVELLDAILHYEAARPGLGARMKDAVDRSILWVADHPTLYRLRLGEFRRINLRVFPYYVAYTMRRDSLWVLAVAHSSRKPLYWINRRSNLA